MRGTWLNPAGGVRYHLRALLAGRAWQPFREALRRWLPVFEAPAARAVLVGPSAGYTLPDAFLRQFSEITVLEPDPLAGSLLGRRLQRLGVSFRLEKTDCLITPLLRGGRGLADLLRSDPAACLVFGNVLGQTRFLMAEPEFVRFKQAFAEQIGPLLSERAWLSFHDRLSGSLAPNFTQPYVARSRLEDSAVLRELYPESEGPSTHELFDHESEGFFANDLPHSYFHWQIARSRWHLIEGVMSAPESWRSETLR